MIFLQHCPLRCFWCCNPETRTASYRTLTPKELYHYIEQDVPYFLVGGGVTFSGGEPLLQSEFLEEFILTYCTDFSVDIETSLYGSAESVRRLLPLIHTWNVDLKVSDEDRHIEYTGVSNRRIKENLQLLREHIPPDRIVITYPIVPGYNDCDENILQMIRFMNTLQLSQVELHPYRKVAEQKQRAENFPVTAVPPLSQEQYQHIQSIFLQHGIEPIRKESPVGKEKCAYLKQLRRQLCETYDLSLTIPDCPVTAPCIGTCPQCEHELQQIGEQLHTKILRKE